MANFGRFSIILGNGAISEVLLNMNHIRAIERDEFGDTWINLGFANIEGRVERVCYKSEVEYEFLAASLDRYRR